jgi:exodeoxyribonuclease VII large subunit
MNLNNWQSAPPAETPWSVEALVGAIGSTLEQAFGLLTVRGEIGQFTRAASGHCYFTLKSEQGTASLRCAMFRRAVLLLNFAPQEGLQVELRARLGVYEARGELQLIVESMRPGGSGALMAQFLRLKARLEAEGLFDSGRKRTLPRWPQRIAVVTSPAASAWHDVMTTLARRAPQVEVVLVASQVQGVEAPAQLVDAIGRAQHMGADVLIVCRGGGSIEDLWAFNDERVVRAIAASQVPVLSGVGHETDFTLADFAADLRAPTPTAAAELVAVARAEALAQLQALSERFDSRLRQRLDREAQRIDRLGMRLSRPSETLSRHRQRLAVLEQRWRAALPRALERQHQRLERLALRLEGLDPHHVLRRGYAWVTDADSGRPLSSVAAVVPGQRLTAVLHDGRVSTEVLAVEPTALI